MAAMAPRGVRGGIGSQLGWRNTPSNESRASTMAGSSCGAPYRAARDILHDTLVDPPSLEELVAENKTDPRASNSADSPAERLDAAKSP